jgi:hypothetical protein
LGGALIGATVVCGVLIAFTYRWLVFDVLPRISAMVALLGIVAFMFAASRFGAAVALLGEQRSVRAQQAVAADRADKRRSG